MDQQFLMDILSRISVSGCEEPVQETVKDYMKEYVDEVRTDEMGNAVCVLHPEHPVRIMLSAHADEIGLIVTRITAEGRIQAVERGGLTRGRKYRFKHEKALFMVLWKDAVKHSEKKI